MNSVHDMGGMANLGPLDPGDEGLPFHAPWEGRVLAMVIASPVRGNIDSGRFARESIPGPEYLAMTYYERWLRALTDQLLAAGAVTAEELASGRSAPAPAATPRMPAEAVKAALGSRSPYARQVSNPPLFRAGDRVRARNLNPPGHTRLPRYVRGREGVVERWHGAHVFPDSHARFAGEDPQHLYAVRFTAEALWGAQGDPRGSVTADLWEPYLERA